MSKNNREFSKFVRMQNVKHAQTARLEKEVFENRVWDAVDNFLMGNLACVGRIVRFDSDGYVEAATVWATAPVAGLPVGEVAVGYGHKLFQYPLPSGYWVIEVSL